MKKGVLIGLMTGALLSVAPAALAAESVEFSGDFRLQERSVNDTKPGGPTDKENFFQFRIRLNATSKIDDNTSLFMRFSDSNNFGDTQSSVSGTQGQIDQYGVKMKSGNWDFSAGRQAVTLGQGAIISCGDDSAGKTDQFDGIIASTKAGDVNFNFIGGKTTTANGSFFKPTSDPLINDPYSAQVYGFDANTKLGDNVTVGVAYGVNKNQFNISALKNWAVNTTINATDNLSFNGEYVKSNASANNSAYFFSGTYSVDKDSFTIQYNNVKGNAVDPYYSGIGAVGYPLVLGLNMGPTGLTLDTTPNYKGFTYTYNHKINKTVNLNIAYMDLKADDQVRDKELTAGLQWSF